MVTRHLRTAGYLVLACSLAQCASLGRRASLAYTAIAAQLAPDEVRVQIDRSFVEAYKDRVTIDATSTVDESSPSPNPTVFDGDLHFAGRAPEIGLRMVGEIKTRGARLHLWGIPRLDFAEISRRVRASSNPATVDEGSMPYEIIVVGVYPDQS